MKIREWLKLKPTDVLNNETFNAIMVVIRIQSVVPMNYVIADPFLAELAVTGDDAIRRTMLLMYFIEIAYEYVRLVSPAEGLAEIEARLEPIYTEHYEGVSTEIDESAYNLLKDEIPEKYPQFKEYQG